MSQIWLKIISVSEMVGGIFGVIFMVWVLASSPFEPLLFIFSLPLIGIFILSFAAGLLLWKDRPLGRTLSIIIQIIQMPKIISPVLVFMFSFGVDFWLLFLVFDSGYTNLGFQFRLLADSQLSFNLSTPATGFGVSVTALIFLGMLVKHKRTETAENEALNPPSPDAYFEPKAGAIQGTIDAGETPAKEVSRLIHGVRVKGTAVDEQTRCAHYHKPFDIIAIKFKCCGEWFPCYECHRENAPHPPEVWAAEEFDTKAILCGNCGYRLTIDEYMKSGSACPRCAALFNPGCANHYHLYFKVVSDE